MGGPWQGAPAMPLERFRGEESRVFWDLENCPLTGAWNPKYNRSHKADFPGQLTAQQHFDLLYKVFASDAGVRMRDFQLHIFISDDTLEKHYSKARRNDMAQLHSSYLISHRCRGKSSGGKPGQHESDVHINGRILRFCESTARKGDVIVIITGDKDHLDTVRKAVQQYGVHVCQLYIEGTGDTAKEWLNGAGYDLVSWAESWPVFLKYHCDNTYYVRPSVLMKIQHFHNVVSEGLKFEEAMGKVGIVMLMDITHSMQPALDDVKDKLERQLLGELQERYPSMKGKFHFVVVGYRDVKSSRQFEVHDFDSDVAAVAAFLRKLRAKSGGDHPEDVAGGLMKVCTLDGWKKTASNILFHVFDAPGHGKRFNDVFHKDSPYYKQYGGDDYFEQPPEGRRDPSEEIAEAMDRLKNDLNVVKYYAVTIWGIVDLPISTTAKTVTALKDIVQEVPLRRSVQHDILSHGNQAHWLEEVVIGTNMATLVNVMVRAASRTLGVTTSASRTLARPGATRRNIDCMPIAEGHERVPQNVRGSRFSLLRPSEMSSGGVDAAKKDKMALHKWVESANGKGFMDRIAERFKAKPVLQCEISMLEPHMDLQDLCERVDSRAGLCELQPSYPIRKYQVLEEPFAKDLKPSDLKHAARKPAQHAVNRKREVSPRQLLTTWFAEEFVLGKMTKYSDNGGYIAPAADLLPVCDAFPHWTYHVTGGRLMVTDVQGWLDQEEGVVRLTDPCIHCQEVGLLDDMNKDYWLQGMENFFKSHTCGLTCKALRLDVVSSSQEQLDHLRARIVKALMNNVASGNSAGVNPDDITAAADSADRSTSDPPKVIKDFVSFLRKQVASGVGKASSSKASSQVIGSPATSPAAKPAGGDGGTDCSSSDGADAMPPAAGQPTSPQTAAEFRPGCPMLQASSSAPRTAFQVASRQASPQSWRTATQRLRGR